MHTGGNTSEEDLPAPFDAMEDIPVLDADADAD